MNDAADKIVFVKSSAETFAPASQTGAAEPGFSLLKSTLEDEGHALIFSEEGIDDTPLDGVRIVVAGVPEYKADAFSTQRVADFLAGGGGVLLMTNAVMMMNPPSCLNETAALAGIKFQEYLNLPYEITEFFPHWITGNVSGIKPGNIACLQLASTPTLLAYTAVPREPFMACASVGNGRFVAIGDERWLRDDYLDRPDHKTLLRNIITWLGKHNELEIEDLQLPTSVTLGQSSQVTMRIRNQQTDKRATFQCILDSDADAIINEPVRSKHHLPPGETAQLKWSLQPQTVGEQQLRLMIVPEAGEPLYFDQLPSVQGTIAGYFFLELKNKDGVMQTRFQTGDSFIVEGMFQPAGSEKPANLSQLLRLKINSGLLERTVERGTDKVRWHLTAVRPGNHKIQLGLDGTDQFLPARVEVNLSTQDQIEELYVTMVQPLDAEIAARLRQVDPSLSEQPGRDLPFRILPTDEYIQALYNGEAELRLQGMLASARREQWFNPDLMRIILKYFLPTYVPGRGAYIPYDPELATHLAKLHPHDRRFLENNLLCSLESNDIQIRQNIAAYLLHERYGHGFFYTETHLGKQVALLLDHMSDRLDPQIETALTMIQDSTKLVNEGFATWLELTFLNKLGREIRPAVTMRRDLLIEKGKGMFTYSLSSPFFQRHAPPYDSPYREGFETFDYIGRTYHLNCVVRIMRLACDIDLGIERYDGKSPEIRVPFDDISRKLLDPHSLELNSQKRLSEIFDYVEANEASLLTEMQRVDCPEDCRNSGCPLEKAVAQHFQWRRP